MNVFPIQAEGAMSAVAKIEGIAGHPEVQGTVTFHESQQGTVVCADLRNVPCDDDDFRALHIYSNTSCDSLDASFRTNRGYNTVLAQPSHTGSFPIALCSGGQAQMCFVTDRFTPQDVIGQTVVLYSTDDDDDFHPFDDDTRIACGVVERAQPSATITIK